MTAPTQPTRQEKQPASDEVTEVAPGILRLQLPISLPGLGHVNCYALEDRHGVAVVDPCLPGPASWRALVGRLRAAGFAVRDVHTVVVTHSHPDHFGGAARLRDVAGAEIVGHRAFRNWWDPEDENADDENAAHEKDAHEKDAAAPATSSPFSGPTPWGGGRYRSPLRRRLRYRAMRTVMKRWFATPRPTRRVEDADVLHLAGREWIAVHTPGHTPDHLCLLDPSKGVLLSGDHVLPTITPHISGIGAGPDPLRGFLDSLDRMHTLGGVQQVLPAHGHPFTDLNGRVNAIREHHLDRLHTLRTVSAELGPATVAELSQRMFAPRSWGQMAESETYAHLEHLRLAGRADRTEQAGALRYLISG
ncbi:MBL fold metallo-hydrolase [soil metagenome]